MDNAVLGLWLLGIVFVILIVWAIIRTTQNMRAAKYTVAQAVAAIFVLIAFVLFVIYTFWSR